MKKIPPKRLPKPQMMDAPEREYMRLLLMYQRAFADILRERLKEVVPGLKQTAKEETPPEMRKDSACPGADVAYSVSRMDADIPSIVTRLFSQVQTSLEQMFPEAVMRKWAQSMIMNVNHIQKRNTAKVAKAVDVEVEPLLTDKGLSAFYQNVVDENVGLIKSMPERQLADVKNAVVFAITNDFSQAEISKILVNKLDAGKSQARLIARDQVNKLNGKLNQYRQQQLGGKRYVWRTAGDSHVREDHRRLNGTMQRWDKPPIVDRRTGRRDNPGQDFQCRCYAELVVEDILE